MLPKKHSFDSEKFEGIGIDAAKVIGDLESELKKLKEQHAVIRSDFEAVLTWLEGDLCKNLTGRK